MASTFSSPPERESSGASKQYPLSKIAAYFSFGRAGSFSGKKQRGENVAREVAITVGQTCAYQLSCLFTVVKQLRLITSVLSQLRSHTFW